jgi:hypothetical protein
MKQDEIGTVDAPCQEEARIAPGTDVNGPDSIDTNGGDHEVSTEGLTRWRLYMMLFALVIANVMMALDTTILGKLRRYFHLFLRFFSHHRFDSIDVLC